MNNTHMMTHKNGRHPVTPIVVDFNRLATHHMLV